MRRLSFAAKINLGITAIVLGFGLFSAAAVGRVVALELRAEGLKRGAAMVRSLAGSVREPLLTRDWLALKKVVDHFSGLGGVEYAFVQDTSGRVLAHGFEDGFPVALATARADAPAGTSGEVFLAGPAGRVCDLAAEVTIAGESIGSVRLGLSWREVQRTVRSALVAVLVITGLGVVGSTLLGTFFARSVTRRVSRLRAGAEEIMRGNLDVRLAGARPALAAAGPHCWELRDCHLDDCPAHGHAAQPCWHVAGTFCEQCGPGGYPAKLESCLGCPVYQALAGDEIENLAEAFDAMVQALRTHVGELRTAEGRLLRQQQLLRTIFDVTPDLVSLQDLELRYKAVNKAFLRYFSLEEGQVLGRTDAEVFGDATGQPALLDRAEAARVLATGQPVSKELLDRRGEADRWFHVVRVPVASGPDAVGLLMTARDNTVIKRYQEQLVQSQKMEDLGKLAGGVAHEINTPLGVILGYAQLLLEDLPQDSPERADVAVIEKQAQVCRRIVADLLKFSRQSSTSWQDVDVNDSIREVLAVVEPIFRGERVRVETSLDPELPSIRGDREKLKQVWLNLLGNARDAIGEDGTIVVRTKLCAHRQRVVVTVADTGQGISPENLRRIFSPFFTTKPVGQGTGLGLSVSFGIIQDHKGRIAAISPAPVHALGSGAKGEKPPGPGTVFMVELPLTEAGLPDEECEDLWDEDEEAQTT